MASLIILKGDKVNFLPAFAPSIVMVQPAQMQASSQNVRINGKAVCLAKDSQNVKVAGCVYMSGAFVVPGSGALSIEQLAANQTSSKVRCNGKPLLLQGMQYQAKFKVESQAQMLPPASSPDPMPQYAGFGVFLPTNKSVRAS